MHFLNNFESFFLLLLDIEQSLENHREMFDGIRCRTGLDLFAYALHIIAQFRAEVTKHQVGRLLSRRENGLMLTQNVCDMSE